MDDIIAATYNLIYAFLIKHSRLHVAQALKNDTKDLVVLKEDANIDGLRLDEIIREWKLLTTSQDGRIEVRTGSQHASVSSSQSDSNSSSDSPSDVSSSGPPKPKHRRTVSCSTSSSSRRTTLRRSFPRKGPFVASKKKKSSSSSSTSSSESDTGTMPARRLPDRAPVARREITYYSSTPSSDSDSDSDMLLYTAQSRVLYKKGTKYSNASTHSSPSSDSDSDSETDIPTRPSREFTKKKVSPFPTRTGDDSEISSSEPDNAKHPTPAPRSQQRALNGKKSEARFSSEPPSSHTMSSGSKHGDNSDVTTNQERTTKIKVKTGSLGSPAKEDMKKGKVTKKKSRISSSSSSSDSNSSSEEDTAKQTKEIDVIKGKDSSLQISRDSSVSTTDLNVPVITKEAKTGGVDDDDIKVTKKRKMTKNGDAVTTANSTSLSEEERSMDSPRRRRNPSKSLNQKIPAAPFKRIDLEKIPTTAIQDNGYEAKKGPSNDYGQKAHRDLIVTRGAGFRKEKNKKKRGSYRGGAITMESHSLKFSD